MKKDERGSVELVVLGLLAALIVVLAFPLVSAIIGDNGDLQIQKSHAYHVEQMSSDKK